LRSRAGLRRCGLDHLGTATLNDALALAALTVGHSQAAVGKHVLGPLAGGVGNSARSAHIARRRWLDRRGRLALLEQRLSGEVFKSVPERIAGTLAVLASQRLLGRSPSVHLTHEQLDALAGTSRETTTKVLGELADQGLISLGRGRIAIMDRPGVSEIAAS